MYKYELTVMGFLHDRPMHGYQIKREVETYGMDSWANISHPLLYQTITKLEKNGLVKCTCARKIRKKSWSEGNTFLLGFWAQELFDEFQSLLFLSQAQVG